MTVTEQAELRVRSVTDDEVQTLFENGWVKLPGLISPDLAGQALARAHQLVGSGDTTPRPGIDDWLSFTGIGQEGYGQSVRRSYRWPSRDDELFARLSTMRELGRNAARLLRRDSSIRLMVDTIGVRLPATPEELDQPIPFHQDYFCRPFDRHRIVFSIALHETTPDQGGVQYYTGSHKLGPLGLGILTPERIQSWTRLRDLPVSEPQHLVPGDAVAHQTGVVEGVSVNRTDRPRWSYALALFPGDSRYLNFPSVYTDGLDLEPYEIADRPSFPLVYEGAAPVIPVSGYINERLEEALAKKRHERSA